jgi:hypothetical protein
MPVEKEVELAKNLKLDIELKDGKAVVSIIETDQYGETRFSRSLEEKLFLDMLIAKLPDGWLKMAAQAAEAAAIKAST